MSSTRFGESLQWNQLKPGLAYTRPTDNHIRVVTDVLGDKRPISKGGPYSGIFQQDIGVDVYTPIVYARTSREVETMHFMPLQESRAAIACAVSFSPLKNFRLEQDGQRLTLKA